MRDSGTLSIRLLLMLISLPPPHTLRYAPLMPCCHDFFFAATPLLRDARRLLIFRCCRQHTIEIAASPLRALIIAALRDIIRHDAVITDIAATLRARYMPLDAGMPLRQFVAIDSRHDALRHITLPTMFDALRYCYFDAAAAARMLYAMVMLRICCYAPRYAYAMPAGACCRDAVLLLLSAITMLATRLRCLL